MNSSTLHTILVLIIIVLLGAIAWVALPIVQSLSLENEGVPYGEMDSDTPEVGVTQKLLEMQDLFNSGEPRRAIQYAEDQIIAENTPMSNSEKTDLYFRLARAYILVDYMKSIALLKEIIASEEAVPERKATAMRDLGDVYMLNSHAAELAHFVFLDEDYGHMLDPNKDLPIIHGLRNVYSAALSQEGDVGPQPIAHFRLAELYLEELFSARTDNELQTEMDLLTQAKHHYSEGVLDEAASTDAYLDPTVNSIYTNGIKALVSGYLALEENNEEMHVQARDLYARSLALLGDFNGPDAIDDYFRAWVNLNYAIYLNESGGDTSEISSALQTIADIHAGRNTTFTGWMWRLSAKETEFVGLREKIVVVAQQNDEFADMLVSLGWTL